jgi:hypothetical protein
MKSKEEIEQLAENQYPIEVGGSMWMPNTNDIKKANEQEGYIKGYIQCQQDMADKKYTKAQIIWVIQEAYGHGRDSEDTIEESIDYIFNSLNKQDL